MWIENDFFLYFLIFIIECVYEKCFILFFMFKNLWELFKIWIFDKFFYGKFELIINLINFIEESLDIIWYF